MTDATFTVPAVHALHIAELVRSWGVGAEQLFAELGGDAERFAIPGASMSVAELVALVTRARALTREPALGIHFGLRMRATAHGYLGFAAMAATTIGDALELAARFTPTRTNALALRLQVARGVASVVIEERADFGEARDAVLFALVLGIGQIGCALSGQELDGVAEFAFARPAYFPASSPRFRGTARFERPVTQLLFDRKVLDLPVGQADPVSRQMACEQCERLLEALGHGGSVIDRVRRLVLKDDEGVRSLEDVAAEMHLSGRTLKRKLAENGATYTGVLDERRREAALLLLHAPDSSIESVAARLGYSDVANFSRAFRRWTGASPGAYRRP